MSEAGVNEPLIQMLFTPDEVRTLLRALAVASFDPPEPDYRPSDDWPAFNWARLVWIHALAPGASPFQQSLGPLATALTEVLPK